MTAGKDVLNILVIKQAVLDAIPLEADKMDVSIALLQLASEFIKQVNNENGREAPACWVCGRSDGTHDPLCTSHMYE